MDYSKSCGMKPNSFNHWTWLKRIGPDCHPSRTALAGHQLPPPRSNSLRATEALVIMLQTISIHFHISTAQEFRRLIAGRPKSELPRKAKAKTKKSFRRLEMEDKRLPHARPFLFRRQRKKRPAAI
jgi:hypothetical protein